MAVYWSLVNLIKQAPVLAVPGSVDEFVEGKNWAIKDVKGAGLMYGHRRMLSDNRMLRVEYWTGRSWGPSFELEIVPSEENPVGFQIYEGYNPYYREHGASFRRYDGITAWTHYDLSTGHVFKTGDRPSKEKMNLAELRQIEGLCASLIAEVTDVLIGKKEN